MCEFPHARVGVQGGVHFPEGSLSIANMLTVQHWCNHNGAEAHILFPLPSKYRFLTNTCSLSFEFHTKLEFTSLFSYFKKKAGGGDKEPKILIRNPCAQVFLGLPDGYPNTRFLETCITPVSVTDTLTG